MQVEFAELRVPILLPANDFLMWKSVTPNLQKNLQGCSHANRWERILAIILQFCGFGIEV
jgi:hypothetical protein